MDRLPSPRLVLDVLRNNPVVAFAVLAALALFGFVFGAGIAARAGDDPPTPTATPVAVSIKSVGASCQAPDSKDSVGREVTYEPKFVIDDDPETAWRCRGDGEGERLVLELDAPARIVEVGIVPGYAKIDSASRADRYVENRRLTKIRWIFDNGASVVQDLDPDPGHRDLQTMQLQPVESQNVTLEVLASSEADLDRIAVSTVRLRAAP